MLELKVIYTHTQAVGAIQHLMGEQSLSEVDKECAHQNFWEDYSDSQKAAQKKPIFKILILMPLMTKPYLLNTFRINFGSIPRVKRHVLFLTTLIRKCLNFKLTFKIQKINTNWELFWNYLETVAPPR